MRKTQEGGVELCLLFLRFLTLTEVNVQKQIKIWCDVQNWMQRIKTEIEREKKDTKQLYRFLPQTGSSPVPLALPRRVYWNVISNYNCSILQLVWDFKLLKHTSKRFPMLKHTSKRLPNAQAHKQETYNQTDLHRKLFEFEHLIYNQWCSQYKSIIDS